MKPAPPPRDRVPASHCLRERRGGVVSWLAAALVFCAALGALAWMMLLPAVAQTRFATATGGTELRVQGLMGDPFSGRATVTGWTLRASPSSTAPVLARGGASEVVAKRWQAALAADPETGVAVIDSLTLRASELVLAPDAKGRWPLLALGASAGLPYERGGKIGDSPRVRVKLLRLSVDTVIVRDSATGRDTPVRIGWRGEFKDIDHSRPIVAALLAAAAGKASTH